MYQGGSEQGLADVADVARAIGADVLLVEDGFFLDRALAAAELLGPSDAVPARGSHDFAPRNPLFDVRVLIARGSTPPKVLEGAAELLLEPRARLVAECPFFLCELELHYNLMCCATRSR